MQLHAESVSVLGLGRAGRSLQEGTGFVFHSCCCEAHVRWVFVTQLNFDLKVETETKILVFYLKVHVTYLFHFWSSERVTLLHRHIVVQLPVENTTRSYLYDDMVVQILCMPLEGFVNNFLKGVGEVFMLQELNNCSGPSLAAVLFTVLQDNRWCSVETMPFLSLKIE